MKLTTLLSCLVGLFLVANAPVANAQQLQSTSGDWRVFTYKKGKSKMCYIASVPTKKTGNYTRRGEPFVLVTYRAKAADEVSISSGYPYKPGKPVEVTIQGEGYKMFSEGERGWAYDVNQDKKMVAAMKRGSKMEVNGTSKKGTFSKDGYSLKGFTKALSSMRKLCK